MPARTRAWMPLYVDDYRSDTNGLSAEVHGAYLLLIMHYWKTGGPVPDDDAQLALIAACTPERWAAIRSTVARFFRIEGGRWRHKRIDLELARNERIVGQKRKAGRARHAKGLSADAVSPLASRSNSAGAPIQREELIQGKQDASASSLSSDSIDEGKIVPLRGRS